MGIASFLTNLLGSAGEFLKKSLSSYCFLETSAGGTVMIAKDGSLASIIRVDGTRKMMGDNELDKLAEYATIKLSPYLTRPGHAIQVWFSRDPDLSPYLVKTMTIPPRVVAKRLEVDLEDLFDERERFLPAWIVQEGFYIVLWTRVSVLTKQQLGRLRQAQKPPPLWPKAMDTQNLFLSGRQMEVRHASFVDAFVQDLDTFGIRAKPLDVHEAMRAIRSSVYPDMFGSQWRPRLPEDVSVDRKGKPRAGWMRQPEIDENDMSHLMWPRLDDQLFDREAEIINQHLVRVGRYIFGGVDLMVGPQDLLPFTDLLNRMRSDEFPWRVSFLLEGDGLPSMMMKSFLASVTQITNGDNRTIRDAIKNLSNLKQQGVVIPRMRVSFATWAPSDQLNLAEERQSRLQKAVEGWGY